MGFTAKQTIEFIKSSDNKKRINDDLVRYNIYNGKLRDEIEVAIRREFKNPDTVNELIGRIIPINILQKIINKLAGVYNQPAIRTPKSKDPNDQELIDLYSESFRINQKMKFANRNFKNMKHTVLDPFIDYKGVPRMRSLPSHTYTVMSDDPVQPDRVTQFVKHVYVNDKEPEKTRFHVWTDEEFKIIDGNGNIVINEMRELGNEDMINPFGVIPQTFISESDDGNLIPISDDDLVTMSIVIPLLLTDLAFASKYQLWSILVITGALDANVDMSPNSVYNLPPGADLKAIKPSVDIDKAIAYIRELVGTLLTTKNLSAGDVIGSMDSKNVQSGVASMLDKSETTEDKKDQQQFFRDAEMEHWNKFAHHILPHWVSAGKLDRDYVGSFSEDFELSIRFVDPKPHISDKETVELEKLKEEAGYTTKRMAIKSVNPELDEEQVQDLELQINKEKQEKIKEAQEAFAAQKGAIEKGDNPFKKKEDEVEEE